MARTDLDHHGFDADLLAAARDAFDGAMLALKPEHSPDRTQAVAAEVALAIAMLARSGERDVERLRRYGEAMGWFATLPVPNITVPEKV